MNTQRRTAHFFCAMCEARPYGVTRRSASEELGPSILGFVAYDHMKSLAQIRKRLCSSIACRSTVRRGGERSEGDGTARKANECSSAINYIPCFASRPSSNSIFYRTPPFLDHDESRLREDECIAARDSDEAVGKWRSSSI